MFVYDTGCFECMFAWVEDLGDAVLFGHVPQRHIRWMICGWQMNYSGQMIYSKDVRRPPFHFMTEQQFFLRITPNYYR